MNLASVQEYVENRAKTMHRLEVLERARRRADLTGHSAKARRIGKQIERLFADMIWAPSPFGALRGGVDALRRGSQPTDPANEQTPPSRSAPSSDSQPACTLPSPSPSDAP